MRRQTPKRRKSIVTGHVTLNLLAELDAESITPTEWQALGYRRDLRVRVRRCSRKEDLTGGAVFDAEMKPPVYSSGRQTRRFHLRPGWGSIDVARLVERAMGWAVECEPTIAARERVFSLAEKTAVDTDEIERLETETGRSSDYSEMNAPGDTDFWTGVLNGMPRKP